MTEALAALTGSLAYGADVEPSDAAHLVFVRSPVAAAHLGAIDRSGADSMPGVLGVFTAEDLGLPRYTQIPGLDDELLQPPLATTEVRFVGQRIAAVVATSVGSAVDAAEHVLVDLDATDPLLDRSVSQQVVGEWEIGEPRSAAPDDVEVEVLVHVPRVAPSPIETTTVLAVPDGDGGIVVHAGSQLPKATHEDLAAALGLERDRVRLICPPMGGAFGAKTVGASPDLTVTCAAALRLGRPVRFAEDRSGHTAVNHARDQHQRWTLVAGPDGDLRHIELEAVADAGAYVATGAMEPATTALMASGPYRAASVRVTAKSVLTNTAPTGPYRGPGRAEATMGLERAMDVLATELGVDPVELRRRNLLRPEDYPHASPTGATYDAADPTATLDAALGAVDASSLRAEQSERRSTGDGRRLGLGISTWVDATAGYFAQQESSLCVNPDGTLALLAGAAPAGQGHAATYAAVIAGRLGVSADDIVVRQPDSAAEIESVGSFGSRSGQVVASAVDDAAERILAQARRLAAFLLEADPDDIVAHDDGRLGVAGVPSSALSVAELGRRSYEIDSLPPDVDPGLASVGSFAQDERTYPSGCHAAVVEVDVETGGVELVRLVGVTDSGRIINEQAARGQAQGGMVQGAAQALLEEVAYDDDGNLLTGNFASYALPSATELPALDVAFVETPTDRNPLGAKGLGESGTVGAPAAVVNAVVDALADLGVRHIQAPCTPERVWRAIADAQANDSP